MTDLRAIVLGHPGALAQDATAALAAIDRGDHAVLSMIVAQHREILDRALERYWGGGMGSLDVLRRERATLDELARGIEEHARRRASKDWSK